MALQQQTPHALTGVAPLGVAPTAATAGALPLIGFQRA